MPCFQQFHLRNPVMTAQKKRSLRQLVPLAVRATHRQLHIRVNMYFKCLLTRFESLQALAKSIILSDRNIYFLLHSIALDVCINAVQQSSANDLRRNPSRNRYPGKRFDSCSAIVVDGKNSSTAIVAIGQNKGH